MWHELVLNGIGGRTIEEAKERMSHREFYEWLEFRMTYGPMNPYYRNDYSIAMLMQQQGGGKIEKYIPFIQLPKKKTNEKKFVE